MQDNRYHYCAGTFRQVAGSCRNRSRDSPVLRLVSGVVVVDGRLLLNDLALGARAGHGGAEEDVDEQHDAEQDAEGDAEPHQPVGIAGTPSDAGAVDGGS